MTPATLIDFSNHEASDRFERQRQAIVRKQLDFGAFLQSENLFCDLSRGVYFDHWVTPEIYSMRFDTRFYIAELPPHQVPLTRSEEVTHSLWLKPEERSGAHAPNRFSDLAANDHCVARVGAARFVGASLPRIQLAVSDPPAQIRVVILCA